MGLLLATRIDSSWTRSRRTDENTTAFFERTRNAQSERDHRVVNAEDAGEEIKFFKKKVIGKW